MRDINYFNFYLENAEIEQRKDFFSVRTCRYFAVVRAVTFDPFEFGALTISTTKSADQRSSRFVFLFQLLKNLEKLKIKKAEVD